jgi:hypothetical protein
MPAKPRRPQMTVSVASCLTVQVIHHEHHHRHGIVKLHGPWPMAHPGWMSGVALPSSVRLWWLSSNYSVVAGTVPVRCAQHNVNNVIFNCMQAIQGLAPALLTLHIRPCIQGEVTSSPDSCLTCPAGSFSFNPSNNTCDQCTPHANCSGGAVVAPLLGFWSSSAFSGQVHR